MPKAKQLRTTRRKTAQIIRFPHDDFGFEAVDVPNSFKERYETDSVLVDIVQVILQSDPNALKRKVHLLPSVLKGHSIQDLVCDLNPASDGLRALAELFECAAARLTVVNAKLV